MDRETIVLQPLLDLRGVGGGHTVQLAELRRSKPFVVRGRGRIVQCRDELRRFLILLRRWRQLQNHPAQILASGHATGFRTLAD